MIEFWQRYHTMMMNACVEHLELVLMSEGLALLLSVLLFLLGRCSSKLNTVLTAVVNVIYTIPSMALFAICVPIVGIGRPAALLALTLYNLFVIFKNLNMGFNSVSYSLIEAGIGIGYTRAQLFWHVQLPQMLPSVFAGLKLSSTMTVGLATIASIVSGGGLGRLMFDGLRRRYNGEVLWATCMCIIMAAVFNLVFQYLEDMSLKKAQGEWKVGKNDKLRRTGRRKEERIS